MTDDFFRIVVLAFLLCVCLSERFQTFREIESIKGKTDFYFYFIKEETVRLEDCAAMCLATAACDSFLHDKSINKCHLIAAHYASGQTEGHPGSSTLYYIPGSAADVLEVCPADFDNMTVPGVCFKRTDTLMVDGEMARDICQSYSSVNSVGHLLTVTANVFQSLNSILGNQVCHIDGYKRLPDETWLDWKGDELPFINWDFPGEPDNGGDTSDPTKEQCVYTRTSKLVHDIPCTGYERGLLCELDYTKK